MIVSLFGFVLLVALSALIISDVQNPQRYRDRVDAVKRRLKAKWDREEKQLSR